MAVICRGVVYKIDGREQRQPERLVDVRGKEVPEPWAGRMRQRGLTRADGQPNISALARAARIAVETARRAVHGVGDTSPDVAVRLADVLGSDVVQWLGLPETHSPWEPPPESRYLTHEERRLLDQLVRMLTDPKLEDERVDPRRSARVTAFEQSQPDAARLGRPHLRDWRDPEVDPEGPEFGA